MAGGAMNETLRAFAAPVAAALLAGCSPHASSTDANSSAQPLQPPLAGASIGGPFTLIDQDGKTVSDRDFAGKYRIIYFGYTFCPDVCPVDMQNLGAAMRLLDRDNPTLSARIAPIFISVDPERDTPAVLKQFVSAFYPRLIGLTGSPAAIKQVADEYRIFYQKQPAEADGGYLVQHSRQAYLFSPAGKPMALLPVEGPPGPIVAEIERWAR
ncbi:SCO family protein [Sphingomonas koreensis]|nr:SCO family protein [Sphingomonas koreensis]